MSLSQVLGSGFKGTCESDATCNLYVVLVLYKVKQDDGTYKHKCDYIRIWSPSSSSAAFHHLALEKAVEHLKVRVEKLKRVRLWTDGHASTYKGFPNFGRMAEFTKKTEIELFHCFFEHDHASGVQDGAGKTPRAALTEAFKHKKTSLNNYYECYVSFVQILFGVPILFVVE
jgi:hypothetical protein